jgi:hypothetical protein
MNNSNLRLAELKELIKKKKQAESVLVKTRGLLITEQENLSRQKISLKKEYEDVVRLEGTNLSSLFYSFLGTKVEKLDKERQEYLSAKLKYESCLDTISRLEEEIKKQGKEIVQTGNPEKEYDELIASKSEQLKVHKDPDFMAITEKLDSVYSKLIEISEAITAGEKVSQGLAGAIQSLSRAKGWGTFDMFGGGMIATAVKHSHIDEAKSQIQNTQYLLKRFDRELQDVRLNQTPNLTPDITGFDKFADFFFDNLIFDWVVQNRISSSLDNCLSTLNKIDGILFSLKEEETVLKSEYKSLKTKLTEFLEKS